MKKTIVFVAALLAISVPAFGQFETVARSHELTMSDVRAPTSRFSSISFRQCETCEHVTARLTAKTRYVVNGRDVRFERFWELFEQVDNREQVSLAVLHHLETDTVLKISFNQK